MDVKYALNIEGEGLEAFLGPTELSVMETLWERNKVALRDIYWGVAHRIGERSQSTITTTLERLIHKGLVQKVGWGVYVPVVTRDEFIQARVRGILDILFASAEGYVVDYLESAGYIP